MTPEDGSRVMTRPQFWQKRIPVYRPQNRFNLEFLAAAGVPGTAMRPLPLEVAAGQRK